MRSDSHNILNITFCKKLYLFHFEHRTKRRATMDNKVDEQDFLTDEISINNRKEYTPDELYEIAHELLTQDQISEVIVYLRNQLNT